MSKGIELMLAVAASLLLVGCEVVTSEKYQEMTRLRGAAERENEDLHAQVAMQHEWKGRFMRVEDAIQSLEGVMQPLAPLYGKNAQAMRNNEREGEEAGDGPTTEIFYLVQSAHAELDKHAAAVASDIANAFTESDFARGYLLGRLQDKVVEVSLDISETTLRQSNHQAVDRRLVTARLKALHESFLALRNLSQNQAFELSNKRHQAIIQKLDQLRGEYAKSLRADYFPQIPRFIPLASGEDYLKSLEEMNTFIAKYSVLYPNPKGEEARKIQADLKADLDGKIGMLKGEGAKPEKK